MTVLSLTQRIEAIWSWLLCFYVLLPGVRGYRADLREVSPSNRGEDSRGDGRDRCLSIPLTAMSYAERHDGDHDDGMERLKQLETLLKVLLKQREAKASANDGEDVSQQQSRLEACTDEQLADVIHESLAARKLASIVVAIHGQRLGRLRQQQNQSSLSSSFRLLSRLERIWSTHLLPIPLMTRPVHHDTAPSRPQQPTTDTLFAISLIIPCYRECGYRLQQQSLAVTQARCSDPSVVEIVIVNAGHCERLHMLDGSGWGALRIVQYPYGGGRGPSLNAGARHAKGRLCCFGHADTKLPDQWDVKIRETLEGKEDRQNDGTATTRTTTRPSTVLACAFGFAVHNDDVDDADNVHHGEPKKDIGTTNDTAKSLSSDSKMLPGLAAVEWMVNFRTNHLLLPYGDQALSMPSYVVRYLGGFPDQCLMEDYDLVRLLRYRTLAEQGKLVILSDSPVHTSARRWHKNGVASVTLGNAQLVAKHRQGTLSPDQLYRAYYHRDPPKRQKPPTGTVAAGRNTNDELLWSWEEELQDVLSKTDAN